MLLILLNNRIDFYSTVYFKGRFSFNLLCLFVLSFYADFLSSLTIVCVYICLNKRLVSVTWRFADAWLWYGGRGEGRMTENKKREKERERENTIFIVRQLLLSMVIQSGRTLQEHHETPLVNDLPLIPMSLFHKLFSLQLAAKQKYLYTKGLWTKSTLNDVIPSTNNHHIINPLFCLSSSANKRHKTSSVVVDRPRHPPF